MHSCKSRLPIKSIILWLTVLSGLPVFAQCPNNLLINGSFTSAEGYSVVAPGWTKPTFGDPDVNDVNGPLNCSSGYTWTGTPLPSPDGGTWQNVFWPEYVKQNIAVLPGQLYQFCFQYAAQGIAYGLGNNYTGTVGVQVLIDSLPAFTTPPNVTQYTWESACFTFSSSTSPIAIFLQPSAIAYVGIDGACIQPVYETSLEPVAQMAYFHQSYTGDNFCVTVHSEEAAEIRLYDISSQLMLLQQFTGSCVYDSGHLPSGMYIYEVRVKDRCIRKGKLVKG
jgi:hypothetical protein